MDSTNISTYTATQQRQLHEHMQLYVHMARIFYASVKIWILL